MEEPTRQIHTLTGLGLTVSQAKVYLTLVKLGRATAKLTSNSTKLPRQEVYRILGELEQKGLIERILAEPTEFQPFSVDDGLKKLIKHRRDETSVIESGIEQILQELERRAPTIHEEDRSHFIMVSGWDEFIHKGRKTLSHTNEMVNIITTAKRFPFFASFFVSEMDVAVKRGVKFRIIIQVSGNDDRLENTLRSWLQTPGYEIRFIHTTLNGVLLTFDNEAILVLPVDKEFQEASNLWTNNSTVLSIAKDYFEMKWAIAVEHNSLQNQRDNR